MVAEVGDDRDEAGLRGHLADPHERVGERVGVADAVGADALGQRAAQRDDARLGGPRRQQTRLADGLWRVRRLAREAGLVVVVSDFRAGGWERALRSLRDRHSVLAVEVGDPRESELPAVGRLALVDPETGDRVDVDTSSRRVRERFAALERDRREHVRRELRRLQVGHVALSTQGDWLLELGRRVG